MRKLLVGGLLTTGLGAAIGALSVRRRYNRWGATDEEVAREMPGDEIVYEPTKVSTRAITIDAPPEDVWPWIVQIGQGRGGFYSYEWIENLLGYDIHNANSVRPELQGLRVGDEVRVFPPDRGAPLGVRQIEPERLLLFDYPAGGGSWCLTVTPENGDRTRLISRNRSRATSLGARAAEIMIDPGDFIMERKMLLGIKERAERLYADQRERAETAVVEA